MGDYLQMAGRQIGLLFDRDNNFPDNELPYECFPDDDDNNRNSNRYTHGLLNASEIATPEFPVLEPSKFPGWEKPMPLDKFD
jgi:hypothetical protein